MSVVHPALHLGPLHLGPLHPAETALVLLLAFGPFVLLALTVWLSRRRDDDDNTRPDA